MISTSRKVMLFRMIERGLAHCMCEESTTEAAGSSTRSQCSIT